MHRKNSFKQNQFKIDYTADVIMCNVKKNSTRQVKQARRLYSRLLLTSLVAQWLRICLPMQGTRVWALVRKDPTCCGTTKPMCHNYWACTLEPMSHNYWSLCALGPVCCNYWARVLQLLSPCAATTEAHAPRACALQQEKPPQWDAHALQRRPNVAKINKLNK